jgi:hypothetical protein
VPETTPTYGLEDKLVLIDGDDSELESLRAQVTDLQQEVLRLRDELIGKDAELGSAKGRIAEMESLINRYESMRHRLEAMLDSTSWKLVWAAGTPVRKFRGRKD